MLRRGGACSTDMTPRHDEKGRLEFVHLSDMTLRTEHVTNFGSLVPFFPFSHVLDSLSVVWGRVGIGPRSIATN